MGTRGRNAYTPEKKCQRYNSITSAPNSGYLKAFACPHKCMCQHKILCLGTFGSGWYYFSFDRANKLLDKKLAVDHKADEIVHILAKMGRRGSSAVAKFLIIFSHCSLFLQLCSSFIGFPSVTRFRMWNWKIYWEKCSWEGGGGCSSLIKKNINEKTHTWITPPCL